MKLLASLFLLAALSLGVVIQGSTSQPVEISLSGGRAFTGEVIAVRDSTVVFGTKPGLSPVEMLNDPKALLVARFSHVLMISTQKNTHPVTGMLIGAPVGCLGGLAIGSAVEVERQPNDTFGCNAQAEHDANKATGMMVGTAVGMLAGCAIGAATGEKGQVLISPEQRDFSFLKSYARYPGEEPESLQRIGR
jgi:hypothetical protein